MGWIGEEIEELDVVVSPALPAEAPVVTEPVPHLEPVGTP